MAYIFLLLFILSNLIFSQDGIIKTYDSNGKLEASLSYINDLYDGTSYWYHTNGNIKKEINYSEGKINGWVREYFESGLLQKEYFVNNGIIDGDIKIYYENGGLKEVLSYNKGIFVSKENIKYDKNYIASPEAYKMGNRQYELQRKKDNILCEIEVCPTPIGGMEELLKNLVYPEHAKIYGLEGIVTFLITIDEKGNVIKYELLKGLGLGCEEAAKDAIDKTKFMPGQNNGNFVSARISISIPFILDKKSEFAKNYRRRKNENEIVRDFKVFDAKKEIEFSEIENNEKENVDNVEVVVVDSDIGTKTNKNIEALEYKIISGSFVNMECTADTCPIPKGGYEQIVKNLVTPLSAFRKDIKGDVIVIAIFDEFGYVRDTKVVQGLGYGCDEAVEVAILGSRFYPAIKNGKKSGTEMIISVPIRK